MAGIVRTISFLSFGTKYFSIQGYQRAAKTFDNKVMERRLDGKLCIVTGANQGLGLQTSEELAKRGAKLFMVCRNKDRGQAAVESVISKTGNQDVHLHVCDISSMEAVRTFAKQLSTAGEAVYCLVNNAGVMVHERSITTEGLDVNFATNTMGAWLLTRELQPALLAGHPAKVIFVSSGGMYTEKLEVDNMECNGFGPHDKYDGTKAYAKDKRRQVAITERFAELWKGTGISVYSMHPGWTTTEGVKKSIPGFYSFYKNKFRELPEGVDTIVYLALEDDAKLEAGGFYLDRTSQPKHLKWGGTQYTTQQVDSLWQRLNSLADKGNA